MGLKFKSAMIRGHHIIKVVFMQRYTDKTFASFEKLRRVYLQDPIVVIENFACVMVGE